LRQAVLEHGWPLLASARGEVIVLLNDTPAKVALYDGQTMFVTAPESAPNAAFIAIADPRTDGARITAAVKAGFMVVTRADDETMEARGNDTSRRAAAFASGAQIVLTDFLAPDRKIGPYQVSIADSRHARCDAANADCTLWNSEFQRTATAH
jgi:hypothetical protein